MGLAECELLTTDPRKALGQSPNHCNDFLSVSLVLPWTICSPRGRSGLRNLGVFSIWVISETFRGDDVIQGANLDREVVKTGYEDKRTRKGDGETRRLMNGQPPWGAVGGRGCLLMGCPARAEGSLNPVASECVEHSPTWKRAGELTTKERATQDGAGRLLHAHSHITRDSTSATPH